MSTNTGHHNSGYYNSGDHNSGNSNSGHHNSGGYNSGRHNSGYYNSGDHNSGNSNSGAFNTNESTVRMFNKETNLHWDDIDFPDYMYFNLTEWIDESDMTDKEKEDNPSYKTIGGYLKTYEYKEAWQKAWDSASKEEKQATKELTNFNADIFYEITGIKVDEDEKMIELSNGKRVSESTVIEALKAITE